MTDEAVQPEPSAEPTTPEQIVATESVQIAHLIDGWKTKLSTAQEDLVYRDAVILAQKATIDDLRAANEALMQHVRSLGGQAGPPRAVRRATKKVGGAVKKKATPRKSAVPKK